MKRKKGFDGSPIFADFWDNVTEFFRGKTDPLFQEHKQKNKLHFFFVVLTPVVIGVLANIIPDNISADMLGLRALTFKSDDPAKIDTLFSSNLWLKSPFLVFAIYSAISFWVLFNRYVSVLHHKIVLKTNWIAALSIILCFVFMYTLPSLLRSDLFLLVFSLSYVSAWIFSIFLRSYIAKGIKRCNENDASPGEMILVNQVTKGWVYVNLFVAIFWLIIYFIFPADNFLAQTTITTITWEFSWVVVGLLIASLIISGIRGAAFSYRSVYLNEVKALNNAYASVDHDNDGSVDGAPENTEGIKSQRKSDTPNTQRVIVFGRGFITSTRLFGSIGSALLIYFSGGSASHSVAAMLFLLFSFSYNDYVDYEKDSCGHPDRAIPSGMLTRKSSLYISILLAIVGICYVYIYVPTSIVVFSALYFFSALYSMALKKYLPAIATPLWSLLIALLAWFSMGISEVTAIGVFMFFYGRELILDYRDIESDDQFCVTKNLPSLLGSSFFIIISIVVALSALAFYISGVSHVVVLTAAMASLFLLLWQFAPISIKDRKISGYSISAIMPEKIMLACFPMLMAL